MASMFVAGNTYDRIDVHDEDVDGFPLFDASLAEQSTDLDQYFDQSISPVVWEDILSQGQYSYQDLHASTPVDKSKWHAFDVMSDTQLFTQMFHLQRSPNPEKKDIRGPYL
jgi:hypothetical protein